MSTTLREARIEYSGINYRLLCLAIYTSGRQPTEEQATEIRALESRQHELEQKFPRLVENYLLDGRI